MARQVTRRYLRGLTLLVLLAACSSYPARSAIEQVAAEAVFTASVPGGVDAAPGTSTSCSRIGSSDSFAEGGVVRVIALDTPLEPFRTEVAELFAGLAESDGWEIVSLASSPEASDAETRYSIMTASRTIDDVPLDLVLYAEIQRPATRLFRFVVEAGPPPDTYCD